MLFPALVVIGFAWLILLFIDIRKEVRSLSLKLENLEKALVNLKRSQQ
jgi:hypothetical protein